MNALQQRIADIKARAKARGVDIDKPRQRPPAQHCPADPPDNAALPLKWREMADDGYQGKREQRKTVERAILAHEVARRLGWIHQGSGVVRHPDTGAGFCIHRDWHDAKRFRASPVWPTVAGKEWRDQEPGGITVSEDRTFYSLARDIQNRLIDQGLIARYEAMKKLGQEWYAKELRNRDRIKRFAEALGTEIATGYDGEIKTDQYSNPYTTSPNGTHVELDYQDRATLVFTTTDDDLMGQVCQFIQRKGAT